MDSRKSNCNKSDLVSSITFLCISQILPNLQTASCYSGTKKNFTYH